MGNNTFTHESGIHAHGVMINPATYEPFSPQAVGWQRRFAIGKHSGRHLLNQVFKDQGFQFNTADSQEILDAVRDRATQLKRGLSVNELLAIATEGI